MPRHERERLLPADSSLRSVATLRSWRFRNHECLNCLEPHPTHVCLDFRTFVCATCAAAHREFGHKVAPVRYWKCTDQEYAHLVRGGNARASAELLANWDEELYPRPLCGSEREPEAVRDFIRKAYVVKCWQRQPRTAPRVRAAELSPHEGALPVQTPRAVSMSSDHFAAVPLETDAALFCVQHDASAKRDKQAAAWRRCGECQLSLRTCYVGFALCPGCSALRGACMICGEPATACGSAASPPAWRADFDDCPSGEVGLPASPPGRLQLPARSPWEEPVEELPGKGCDSASGADRGGHRQEHTQAVRRYVIAL